MEFDKYQKLSRKTAIYKGRGKNIIYPTLGLVGESGEVAEKVKRIVRGEGKIDKEFKEEITKELGDVLWYVANLAAELKISLDAIAQNNLAKLSSRKSRGKLSGSGDNR